MSQNKKLLTIDDVHGAWAILPTPANPDASDWRAEDTVNVDETARAVEGLIAAGIDGILSLGTLGECASLSWEEKAKFIAAAVEAAAGRVPFFAGTTSLNTRETIRQTREASRLGAVGTMLGLPMWCPPDIPTAVQFYRDVAEACPEMAICVYANPAAFRFDFPPAFWAQVAEIPQVITAKYGLAGRLFLETELSKKQIRFMPRDADYYWTAKVDPEFFTAFWTSGAVCGPTVTTVYRDEVDRAKRTGDWASAQQLSNAMGHATAPMFPNGDFAEFARHNVGLEKERINAAGWMNCGPIRPPHHVIPENYAQGGRRAGEMWAALNRKLEADSVGPTPA